MGDGDPDDRSLTFKTVLDNLHNTERYQGAGFWRVWNGRLTQGAARHIGHLIRHASNADLRRRRASDQAKNQAQNGENCEEMSDGDPDHYGKKISYCRVPSKTVKSTSSTNKFVSNGIATAIIF